MRLQRVSDISNRQVTCIYRKKYSSEVYLISLWSIMYLNSYHFSIYAFAAISEQIALQLVGANIVSHQTARAAGCDWLWVRARALLNRLCGRGHQVVNARVADGRTLCGVVGMSIYLLLKVGCDPRPTGHMPTDSIIFDFSQSAGRAHLRIRVCTRPL